MARLVPRISPQTICKRVNNNPNKKIEVFVAGLKVDKFASGEFQKVQIEYVIPTKASCELTPTRWNDGEMVSRLKISYVDEIGKKQTLSRWEMNNAGVYFFETKQRAIEYFYVCYNRITNTLKPIDTLVKNITHEMSPSTIDYLKSHI